MRNFFKNGSAGRVALCCLVTAFICVLLVLAVFHVSDIIDLFGWVLKMLSTVIIAAGIAYLLTPLVRLIETRVFRITEGDRHAPVKRILSAALVYFLVVALLTLFVQIMIPQLKTSYSDLIASADSYYKTISAFADKILEKHPSLADEYATIAELLNKESISELLSDLVRRYFDTIAILGTYFIRFAEAILVGAYRGIIAVILSFWMVISRGKLASFARDLCRAVFGEKRSAGIFEAVGFSDRMFGGFIVGKIIDSLVVGVLYFIILALLGIPYYPIIALVACITNMIPYFGPMIAVVFGGAILIIPSPGKALLCVAVSIAIMQLDGNVIEPRILGDQIGLRSIWVIISITVFGELFGILGMFLGAPAFAVLLEFARRWLYRRLIAKNISPDDLGPIDRPPDPVSDADIAYDDPHDQPTGKKEKKKRKGA